MKRWHLIVPITAAVAAFFLVFSVRATDDGFALMYRWSAEQARECDEGGGCVIMSHRQVGRVVMLMLQDIVQQNPQTPSRPGNTPRRSDI